MSKVIDWYKEIGVDEVIEKQPTAPLKAVELNKFIPSGNKTTNHDPIEEARVIAANCNDIESLKRATENFNGCALKKMATNTVFSDGDPNADFMLVGEAPGASEDAQGIPFCGDSGKLLNLMFAAIGYPREHLYISNTIFWRPPGNRKPTDEEIAICSAFVEKHIFLKKPKLIIAVGSTAASSLLKTELSMGKLRGKIHQYSNALLSEPIPTFVIFHPAYLLRQPTQKKEAWADLLHIKQYINDNTRK